MNVYADHVVVRVQIRDAAAAELRPILEKIIKSHAVVAASGGFSNPERYDAPSLEFNVRGEPNDFEYRAQARFVDRGAWRVLLDALRGELWVRGFDQQSAVECSVHRPQGGDLTTEVVGSLRYPDSPTTTPFDLTWMKDGPPWHAAIHLSFRHPPEQETAREIAQFFDHWQHIIRAYRPPPVEREPDDAVGDEERNQILFGGAQPATPVWSHPRTVELGLTAFLADDPVFHPVVNYACWLQRRAAIEELIID